MTNLRIYVLTGGHLELLSLKRIDVTRLISIGSDSVLQSCISSPSNPANPLEYPWGKLRGY